MTIGDRIKNLRISMGLTQEELATCTKTTKQTIHKYETGIIQNIPASKVQLLADTLNTTPSYLMGWDDKKTAVVCDTSPTKDDTTITLFKLLDESDKSEIRGEIKQMLKADKYTQSSLSIGDDMANDITKLMNMPVPTGQK